MLSVHKNVFLLSRILRSLVSNTFVPVPFSIFFLSYISVFLALLLYIYTVHSYIPLLTIPYFLSFFSLFYICDNHMFSRVHIIPFFLFVHLFQLFLPLFLVFAFL